MLPDLLILPASARARERSRWQERHPAP